MKEGWQVQTLFCSVASLKQSRVIRVVFLFGILLLLFSVYHQKTSSLFFFIILTRKQNDFKDHEIPPYKNILSLKDARFGKKSGLKTKLHFSFSILLGFMVGWDAQNFSQFQAYCELSILSFECLYSGVKWTVMKLLKHQDMIALKESCKLKASK